MQQHPDDARRYGLAALNRALDGVTGTVAVHLCFGYAALVHGKPAGYSFLPELENCKGSQISIEAAQPRLDLKILKSLPSKTIVLGVNDLADLNAETPDLVAARIRAALGRAGGAARGRARLRHEIPAARDCVCQNESARRRRRDREAGD
jgi:5-methyltetrahydropteroyltriglutamate--homocysteine methyltransferase